MNEPNIFVFNDSLKQNPLTTSDQSKGQPDFSLLFTSTKTNQVTPSPIDSIAEKSQNEETDFMDSTLTTSNNTQKPTELQEANKSSAGDLITNRKLTRKTDSASLSMSLKEREPYNTRSVNKKSAKQSQVSFTNTSFTRSQNPETIDSENDGVNESNTNNEDIFDENIEQDKVYSTEETEKEATKTKKGRQASKNLQKKYPFNEY